MNNYSIIVENDVSKWKDETGSRYHFPKKYLNILKTGTKVIYYKGRIKDKSFSKNRLSDNPHYFGIATIGQIRVDEKNSKNYFAEIIDYIPFKKALLFKKKGGEYYEKIPSSKKVNYWRDGVREIERETYDEITLSSDLTIELKKSNLYTAKSKLSIVEENLLKYYSNNIKLVVSNESKLPYSKNAKEVGDLGEQLVYEYLKSSGVNSLVWHANVGETPGYDISFIDKNNNPNYVEVKTTTGKLFNNFLMTINEVNSAKKLGVNYKVYLVSDCLSSSPKLNIIDNPTLESNFIFEPISFKVTKFE
ncbi:DUF3883 domain-containing protein [Pseudotenacibaculum sp. MALMAid0570]|uniref:DUF3883 domain-containing protein n=1 Tax=Pseudotenacibaculum sp. MALMAid0570 TaxID=3143938 RepID=UPI0032DEB0A2